MDFNTLLLRLGISPDNFINKDNEPIPTSNGFIYDLEQSKDDHYKKAYQENIARLDAERYAKAQNPVVKPEQIPLGTPVPKDISGANSLWKKMMLM